MKPVPSVREAPLRCACGPLSALLLAATGGCLGSQGTLAAPDDRANPQGALIETGRPLDLSIDGKGLLVVGQDGDRQYVRGGRFHVAATGNLINLDGRSLQGYDVGPDGSALLSDVHAVTVHVAPLPETVPTHRVVLNFVLNPGDPILSVPFDAQMPSATSSYGTSANVIDANGKLVVVAFYLCKMGPMNWQWFAVVQASDVGGEPGTNAIGASGVLMLNGTTDLGSQSMATTVWNFANTGSSQTVQLQLNVRASSALGSSYSFEAVEDGLSSEMRTDLRVLADGTLIGTATGRVQAKLPLAMFRDFSTLALLFPGAFQETQGSGPPRLGNPDTRVAGRLVAGVLESDWDSTTNDPMFTKVDGINTNAAAAGRASP